MFHDSKQIFVGIFFKRANDENEWTRKFGGNCFNELNEIRIVTTNKLLHRLKSNARLAIEARLYAKPTLIRFFRTIYKTYIACLLHFIITQHDRIICW